MKKATILGMMVLFVAGLFLTFNTADAAVRVRSYFCSNGKGKPAQHLTNWEI